MYSDYAIYLYIVYIHYPAYSIQYLQVLFTAEDRADQFKSMSSPYISVCGQFPVAVGLGITGIRACQITVSGIRFRQLQASVPRPDFLVKE